MGITPLGALAVEMGITLSAVCAHANSPHGSEQRG